MAYWQEKTRNMGEKKVLNGLDRAERQKNEGAGQFVAGYEWLPTNSQKLNQWMRESFETWRGCTIKSSNQHLCWRK